MFSREALVMDKWFALQATAPDRGGNVLPVVRQLMQHPDFTLKNPNRARSLIFSFCNANPAAFHRSDAAGYVFWSERVLGARRLQPPSRRPLGTRPGPLAQAGRALPQRSPRGAAPALLPNPT
jgi:aminopeptidase N